MNYKQHLIVGTIVAAIVCILLYFTTDLVIIDLEFITYFILVTYVYALLPDIDHPISKITWNFLGIGIIGVVVAIINTYYHFINNGTTIMIASVILLALTFVCAQLAVHRGKIHTIVAGLIFAGAFYFIEHNIGLCIISFAAYYSHLFADGLWNRLI